MKRISDTEWTDGKNIYIGNPRDGFKLKTVEQPPVMEDAPIVEEGIQPTGEQ
jgi:hypothetical protein